MIEVTERESEEMKRVEEEVEVAEVIDGEEENVEKEIE